SSISRPILLRRTPLTCCTTKYSLLSQLGSRPSTRSATESRNLLSESVREHHLGLHSFRSMRRIEASLRKASALRLRHSQSLASLRDRPRQGKVRSTSQRFGSTTKRWA